jgi:hypothetical protein
MQKKVGRMSKQNAHLDNWSVMGFSTSPYAAPEQASLGLVGTVKGHPLLADDTVVHTSEVKMISYKKKLAVTRNTIYTLGEPDADFVRFLAEGGHNIEDYEFGKMDQ